MTRRWEHFDHTADLGIRAEGATLGEAFAEAAAGLFAHIADPALVRDVGEVRVEVEAPTPEGLLLAWLEELRYLSETRLLLFARFEADVIEPQVPSVPQVPPVPAAPAWRCVGRAFGEAYDEARHGHIHEVKAITRHGLAVEREPPRVEVILDI